jgi:hypothetical protein
MLAPLEAGAAHDSETLSASGVAVRAVGVPGVVAGVICGMRADHAPWPTEFTAATLTMYAVPLMRPVTVADVAVLTPSLKVAQVLPANEKYWTT